MRQRRPRRTSNSSFSLDLNFNLKTISTFLFICIVVLFIVFIYSAIKSNKFFNHNNIADINNGDQISERQENSNPEDNDSSSNEELAKENATNTTETSEAKPLASRSTTINMAFTGDIMCHNTIYNDAYNSETSTYDFSYIFDNIKYHLQTPDITVGNLETTFAGAANKYSSYPKFNTPESLAYNLKKLGFDVVSTANNHCYDSGYSGIESTIKYLDDADISHTGTYTSEEEQNTVLIKNVKGIEVAFLSFTYGTNGITIPSDKSYSVNLDDEGTIIKQLTLAKEKNPDLICACIHWGTEYQTTPNSTQTKLADLLFNNGADIIIGNHPHVLQPMEKREITLADGSTKDGFVVYSLGNFLADQNKTYTSCSAILNLNITKNEENKISINSASYTPIYIYKDSSASQKFKLIDLKNVVAAYDAGYTEGVTPNMYKTFSTELNNVKKLLGEEIK